MPDARPARPRRVRVRRRLAPAALAAALATASAVLGGLAFPTAARAQSVERPVPFDSAGRLPVITPVAAARLKLAPPAWRVTGDYREARLYSLGNGGYVVAVTRPGGTVERYSLTAADRAYLAERTRNLPPGLDEQISAGLAEAARTITGEARNAFVRNQTLLGLTVYAPSFAYAVTNEAAGRVAIWLLVSGGTFFGASSLARDITITPTMNNLATLGAIHGGAAGWGLTYALGARNDGKAVGIFLGSLAGTAAGLYFGKSMTPAQVAGTAFGADALALMTAGLFGGAGAYQGSSGDARAAAAGIVAAAAVGAPLGGMYPKMVSYNVTAGDITTLWFTGGLGALGATSFVANSNPNDRKILYALVPGFIAGTFAGDRLLVKRLDHSGADAGYVGLGAAAGALMGAGVSVLLDSDHSNKALVTSLSTLGGIGGIAAAEYYTAPKSDAGRLASHLRVSPAGLAMAVARREGVHPILSVSF
jgi:hypothetical protein